MLLIYFIKMHNSDYSFLCKNHRRHINLTCTYMHVHIFHGQLRFIKKQKKICKMLYKDNNYC